MAFMNNTASGGDFTVFVKYNAKAGRFYTKKDEPDAEEFEVKDMTAVFDMDGIQTGWFLFAPGVAPVKHMDPSLSEPAPSPGDGFKRGFQLNLFSEKNLLGLREFSSTAGAVIDAMNELHDHWLADKDKNAGKVPVVKCVGVSPITNKHGTNYKPQFEIVKWTDRPDAFDGKPVASTQAASKPAPEPEPTSADDDVEF